LATLLYTTDSGRWQDRTWQGVSARVAAGGQGVGATLPAGARAYFVNAVDRRGLVMSSEHEGC
jgi:hypothetical protein